MHRTQHTTFRDSTQNSPVVEGVRGWGIMFDVSGRVGKQIHPEHQAGGAATTSVSKTGTKEFRARYVLTSRNIALFNCCKLLRIIEGCEYKNISFIFLILVCTKMEIFLVFWLGFSVIWTDSRFYSSDHLWRQLWFWQDREFQGFSGNSGGGRSSLQADQARLHQEVREVFLQFICLCNSNSCGHVVCQSQSMSRLTHLGCHHKIYIGLLYYVRQPCPHF